MPCGNDPAPPQGWSTPPAAGWYLPPNIRWYRWGDYAWYSLARRPTLGEGMIRGEPLESVSIVEPSDGAVLRHGEDVTIVVQVTPEEKFASLRMFCNGQQMHEQEGQLAPITWPTSRGRPGEYVLEAEVRFTNRRVIRSAPVTVTLSVGVEGP